MTTATSTSLPAPFGSLSFPLTYLMCASAAPGLMGRWKGRSFSAIPTEMGGLAFMEPLSLSRQSSDRTEKQADRRLSNGRRRRTGASPSGPGRCTAVRSRAAAGVVIRFLIRIPALTAAIRHNDKTGRPIKRSLIAYDR